MKKILCLILAIAMAFSMVSAASFTDESAIGINYIDDVNMLVQLGVIGGYPDGSFGPQNYISRAEFAKMAYTLKYGSDNAGNLFAGQPSAFVDVANDNWAVGYINYCANQKIVSGVGNGKFNPNGNITVAEATKMILVILGCDPAKEGLVGANWAANTVSKAIELGVFDGWTGDPTQFATRELVAKLMKNAIFSPVYKYSAITGTGSQYNILGVENETFGEETMGLKAVTGIVVANENYAINTDPEGEEFTGIPTSIDEDESVVFYETKDTNGNVYTHFIVIDRALSNEYLGCKVNVYFQADGKEGDYRNIEVIGDVLVDSDTVVHIVPGSEIEVYPNGDSKSEAEITPYIAFNGVEIKADRKIKVAKNENILALKDTSDYLDEADMFKDEFEVLGYEFDDDDLIPATSNFTNGFAGTDLVDYRFVSVDGGNTYSYIFKTAYGHGTVTTFRKDTFRISGLAGTYYLEDVILNGDIAEDDYVVYTKLDEKLIVYPVETVTGAVGSYAKDAVYINGNAYKAWSEFNDNIVEFMKSNKKLSTDKTTTYYAYNNLILDIEEDKVFEIAEDYAVILKSNYDEDAGVAFVTLGFSDGTTGRYQVTKTKLANKNKLSDPDNNGNRPSDFKNNKYVGYVVEYKLTAGGVDLSGQDFAQMNVYDEAPSFTEGSINNTHYIYNEDAILFILSTEIIDEIEVITHDVYKLNDVNFTDATVYDGNSKFGTYVADTSKYSTQFVVAASAFATVDKKPTPVNGDNVAYVLNAIQYYNSDNDTFYVELTLATEDGEVVINTVEDIDSDLFDDDDIGVLNGNGAKDVIGSIVEYKSNGEYITYIEEIESEEVTITDQRIERIFYNNGKSKRYSDDLIIITIDEDTFEYIGNDLITYNGKEENPETNAYIITNEVGEIEVIFSFTR